jgi:TolA-binding protein
MSRSWEAEQPTPAAHARARAIADLAVVGTVAATSGAASTKGLAAVGGSLAPKAAAAGGALTKWLLLVALAGAGTTVALLPRWSRARAPAATPGDFHSFDIHEAMSAWPVLPAPVSTPATTEAPRSPEATVTPRVSSTSATRARTLPPRATSTARPASLGEQVTSLDRARRALQDGDSALAERRVDEYEATFPGGSLREEAEALRIEALLGRGDVAAARRMGARFLAAYPASVHARRFRALVGGGASP